MQPYHRQLRKNLTRTIINYIESISGADTRHDKIMLAKIFFEYMITEKNNILDLNIMSEFFISTVKHKLIELNNLENVPWAYNFYLMLFDEIMPNAII